MSDLLENTDLVGIVMLAIGGAALGLAGLFDRSGRWWRNPGAWVALALALAAAGLASAGQPATIWGVAALLAAVDFGVRTARRCQQTLTTLGQSILKSRRVP